MAQPKKPKKLPKAHEDQIRAMMADYDAFLRSGVLAVVADAAHSGQKSIQFKHTVTLKLRADDDYEMLPVSTQPAVKYIGSKRRMRQEGKQLSFLGAMAGGDMSGNGSSKPSPKGSSSKAGAESREPMPAKSDKPGPLH